MELKQKIASWDGKEVSHLVALYQEHGRKPQFAENLVDCCCTESKLQPGCTWLIKHYLEKGGRLSQEQIARMMRHAQEFQHWETKLQWLQCFDHLSIPLSVSLDWYQFTEGCLQEEKPFLRAWAFNSLYLYGKTHPERRNEILNRLNSAVSSENASVKARVRNLLIKGFR